MGSGTIGSACNSSFRRNAGRSIDTMEWLEAETGCKNCIVSENCWTNAGMVQVAFVERKNSSERSKISPYSNSAGFAPKSSGRNVYPAGLQVVAQRSVA
ncbi:hypothetical protein TNIN_456481 [Trichonephila inaurata madagascariensis]|uniref:Uncharacterized protein n=1 Tax=Trichonephila inaurata madagascariensis TaxID=2747483 RepID=A0A8X6MA26_9ARAC|nr:hypothetical protein TNIN_456481 [Trichonephila inaurata madagascariensis]